MNILFISLGCDKNLVDTEVMLGMLDSRGYQMVDTEEEADVIVVNTCCFIHDAKEESINTILQMAEYKKTGQTESADRDRLSGTAISERDLRRDSGSGCEFLEPHPMIRYWKQSMKH